MKTVSVLGSTGSIGTLALEVARLHNFKVRALAAHSNAALLAQQAKEFLPGCVCIFREEKAGELRELLSRDADTAGI